MTVINRGTASVTVNIYVARDGGTSRLISPPDLLLEQGETVEWDYLDFDEGDVLEGDTSAGANTEWYFKTLEYTSNAEAK